MADNKQVVGGLPVDVTKISGYGVPPESLQALRDALQSSVTALEQRYAQPNWFKVAEGFLKPQLGGFFASLGSAAGALGENVEQQRASQIPIAQLRAQIAQSDILMGQNKKVSEMETKRKAEGRPLTPAYVSEVTALAPDSTVAKALANELTTMQKQQDLLMQSINLKVSRGMPLSPEEQALLGQLPTQPMTAKPPAAEEPAVKFNLKDMTPEQQISTLRTALAQETDPKVIMGVAQEIQRLQSGAAQAFAVKPQAPEVVKKEEPKFYPQTLKMPDVSGMSSAQMEATRQTFTDQAAKTEGSYLDKFTKIAGLASGPEYNNTRNTFDSAIGMMSSNPELSAKVFNLIRNNGQVAAALNAGLGVSMGGWGASINLPVKPFLEAGFSPQEQKFADTLLTYLTQLGAAKLKTFGQTTATTTQQEYMAALRAAAGLDQQPQAAMLTLMKDKANFDLNREMYELLVQERREKADPQSLTKLTDVFQNSPRLKELEEKYRRINERLDQEFQQTLRKP